MGKTADQRRAALNAIQSEHNKRMAEWIASLPEAPLIHRCPAEWGGQLQWVEELGGYYDIEIEKSQDGTKRAHATTNGWDDIGEEGSNGYVLCTGCYGTWRSPDDFDWN